MKLADILTLVNAGYTRAEIDAMETGETPPAPPAADMLNDGAEAPPANAAPNDALAAALIQALTAKKPEPKEEPKAEPKEEPKQEPKAEDSAARILSALGLTAQSIAIPREETLEDRMANSLRLALGIREEKKEV